MHRKLLISSALAVLALAACDKSATDAASGGAATLSRSEVQTLAGETGDQDGAFMDGMGGPGFNLTPAGARLATTVTTTFTRTRTCPQGGSVKMAGTVTHTADPATHSGSTTFSATRTDEACAFNRGGATITLTGNPNVALTASQSVTNGVPGVRTASKKGSFNWTRGTGGSGTCTVDVTATWTPATHTLHVAGTFCNQTVDVTRTWTQS